MEYLSRQRYDDIANELDHLITVVYPQIREDVAETSAQGDRSENAGYREARRKQAKAISMTAYLIARMKNKLQTGLVVLASGMSLIMLLSTMVALTSGSMSIFMLSEPVILLATVVAFVVCLVKRV